MLPGQTRSGQTSLYQISWKHTKANTTKNKEVCVYSRGRGKLFAPNNSNKQQQQQQKRSEQQHFNSTYYT